MDITPNIDEAFFANHVAGQSMDKLWADGWRHQGSLFFRYDACEMQGEWHRIVPVRVRAADFLLSKSQRRVCKRNRDIRWEIRAAVIDEATQIIFDGHRKRFTDNVPESIHNFFTHEPDITPCKCLSVRAFLDDKLIAASFLDLGEESTSSVYAIFDPVHAKRGLGTLTLLKEIEITLASGRVHFYPGYATREPSHYDYKKTFSALEGFDWATAKWYPWDGSTDGPQPP